MCKNLLVRRYAKKMYIYFDGRLFIAYIVPVITHQLIKYFLLNVCRFNVKHIFIFRVSK